MLGIPGNGDVGAAMTEIQKPAKSNLDPATPVVFLIEDDPDYRESLRMVIAAAGFPVADFGCAEEFFDSYQPKQRGCLVVDLQTPGFDAVELYSDLVKRGGAQPFIVISSHGSVPKVSEAMRHGAVDFLAKPVSHGVLIERIREAIALDASRRGTVSKREGVRRRLDLLTKREREVLALVVSGYASKQIAKKLDVGTNTVDVHRSNIMKKMVVSSSVELVRMLTVHSLLSDE